MNRLKPNSIRKLTLKDDAQRIMCVDENSLFHGWSINLDTAGQVS